MAQSLNRSRIFISKSLGVFSFLVIFLSFGIIQQDGFVHETLDIVGAVMLAVCAMGRVYTTAFLGGNKNVRLIKEGPFSVVRNPLYVFSLIGFMGISLMSNHIVLIILTPLSFFILYHFLVSREEAFLREGFGAEYDAYILQTPRFFPDFSKYTAPETLTFSPKLLLNGVRDAVWWFAAYPLVEFAEFVRDQGFIKPIFFIP